MKPRLSFNFAIALEEDSVVVNCGSNIASFWSFNLRLNAHCLIESLLGIFSHAYYHTSQYIILIYTESLRKI